MLLAGVLMIPGNHIVGVSTAYVFTEVICTLSVLGVLWFSPSKKYVSEHYGQNGKCFEKSYIIETESMSEISGNLETLCDEWEIPMKQAFFINFICEELLLNLFKFGLGHKSHEKKDYYISIKLMERNGDFVLRIRDNISIYNPFESEGDEIDTGVLRLIQKKTKYCNYQRKMIFNYLYMII